MTQAYDYAVRLARSIKRWGKCDQVKTTKFPSTDSAGFNLTLSKEYRARILVYRVRDGELQ